VGGTSSAGRHGAGKGLALWKGGGGRKKGRRMNIVQIMYTHYL
jgi:hypothetical protein